MPLTASTLTAATPFSRLRARFEDFTAAASPVMAVEIAAGRLAVGRAGAGAAAEIRVRSLPAGAVVASAVRTNLADPESVAQALRALLEAAGGAPEPVTLLVPDLTARVSVLDFDVLPARRDELDALARFRLRKSLPFAEEQAVISCQVLSPTRLLVAIADRVRVDEYESCLAAAGAGAAIVLPSGLACLAGDARLDHDTLLVRAEAGSLTTAFCRHERIEFFRAIELSAPADFDDVFPSVAYFRDRVEASSATPPEAPALADGGGALLTAGVDAGLRDRLAAELPGFQVRAAASPEQLAVAGALRGRFA